MVDYGTITFGAIVVVFGAIAGAGLYGLGVRIGFKVKTIVTTTVDVMGAITIPKDSTYTMVGILKSVDAVGNATVDWNELHMINSNGLPLTYLASSYSTDNPIRSKYFGTSPSSLAPDLSSVTPLKSLSKYGFF